jgi:hypothetical protein
MYIIDIGDDETEALYRVFVGDMQEFTDVIDYIKMSPQLVLLHVTECYLAFGLEGLKEILSEGD